MNYLMKPEKDTQEPLIQDFSLPVLGILTAAAIGDPTGVSAAGHPSLRQRSAPPSHQPSDYQVNLKVISMAKHAAEGIGSKIKKR